jgi:hypothetical protein
MSRVKKLDEKILLHIEHMPSFFVLSSDDLTGLA